MNSILVRAAVFTSATVMIAAYLLPRPTSGAAQPAAGAGDLYRRDNLIAWCIVPFDAKKRGPEERAAMLEKLGFKHFAYDFRAEHVPTFDAEIEALKRHGVSLDAWWFPSSLNEQAKQILAICKKHDVRPQLWVSGGGAATANEAEQRARVKQEAARIRPIAEAAVAQGMKVGLYNHGGWYGEPENQLEIIAELGLPNVGIIYNFHHGHDHLERFAKLLPKMLPHLLVINLNGMVPQGDKQGQKILQLGQGTLDLELLKTIRASGYTGPIGILGHTQDDAEARLADNLDGLDWLLPQLDGKPAGPKPKPRTPVPGRNEAGAAAPAAKAGGWTIAGRDEYRTAPLTVTVRGTLTGSAGYNILVACDTKASGAHWEVFTMPKSGLLTAYLPGSDPDHVRSNVNIVDGKPHSVTMTYGPDRVRLYVDGKPAAEQAIKSRGKATVAGELAVGRLVEGYFLCDGKIESLRLTRGLFEPTGDAADGVSDGTVGLWTFGSDGATDAVDASPLKNPAKRTAAATAEAPRGKAPMPPAGVHLKPVDARLKATLIDRSADEVFMGVKVDTAGNVFVGGRRKVFVYDRKVDGGLGPRRELLTFPPDSIIMGLEFRGDDLYVLTDNALYLVSGGRVARDSLSGRSTGGLRPERILWGLPLDLHVSFHCLAWGPNGDLYLTHGDPLLGYGNWERPDHWGHWTLYCGRENKPLPYTGQGAVLRMKPDGTDVQVVARGLRGPVGLAFDRQGNLFTNDNDHESRADQYAPSRLLHVTEGVDFGWPRGWMASKSPDRFDLVDSMCDLGRGVPCDLAWYDHGLMADVIGERLLMCRWDRHNVSAYRLEPRGTTFSAAEEAIITGDENCRPVGIAADGEGRLYVTALYMTGNMAAPDCVSDLVVIERADGEIPKIAAKLEVRPAEGSHGEAYDLVRRATSDDPYVRQRAAALLAGGAPRDQLQGLLGSNDEASRLAGVLIVGCKLTVPTADFVPPAELELSYPKGSAFFHREQLFFGSDKKVDLADLGRIGSFTIAQWWAALEKSGKRTAEQAELFDLLIRGADDSSDRVRLQAVYYLSLLNDARSEPIVARVRRDVQLKKLSAASGKSVMQAWEIGPFDFAEPELEGRPVDLTVAYRGRNWHEWDTQSPAQALPPVGVKPVNYYSFRVTSRSRQSALVSVAHDARLWQNETTLKCVHGDELGRQWIVVGSPGTELEFAL